MGDLQCDGDVLERVRDRQQPQTHSLAGASAIAVSDATHKIRKIFNNIDAPDHLHAHYEQMLVELCRITNARYGLFVPGADVAQGCCHVVDGKPAVTVNDWQGAPGIQYLTKEVENSNSVLIINRVQEYLQTNGISADRIPFENLCAATISSCSQVKGIILIGGKLDDNGFTGQDEEVLALLLEDLSIALERLGLIEELKAKNEVLLKDKREQQSLIKQLEDAHDQLLQSEKMASIGQLAAGVAHEINNPVGYVSSNLSSLQRYINELFEVLDVYQQADSVIAQDASIFEKIKAVKESVDLEYLREDLVDLLEESAEGVKRVKHIVQDLKDFSHADAGEWEWSDLHKGIDSTMNIVWNELKYKADVVKEYGDIPSIECIPSQLNQVFMNLMVNAAHAIEDRGTITVRTGELDENRVWVEIEDTGKGISEEHLKRIFDPFFTTKPVGKGTGLGLSLSYGIIEKHGGKIEVSSTIGEGTKFRVVLPVTHASSENPAADV